MPIITGARVIQSISYYLNLIRFMGTELVQIVYCVRNIFAL